MEFQRVFTIKKTYSTDEFLRAVMIGLTKDKQSPSDIMTAKFGKVTEYTAEVAWMEADIDVHYSGSVGYDRKEEYQEWNSSSNKYETKTKTVTDWRPHSGNLNTTQKRYTLNVSTSDKDFEELFSKALAKFSDDLVTESGSARVNTDAASRLQFACEQSARYEVSWPGDHHKDTRYSCKTDIKVLEGYIAPCYEVEYEYEGKKYKARGFAFGKPAEIHTVPENSASTISIEDIETQRSKDIDVAEKPYKKRKIAIIGAVVGAVAALIGLFGGMNSAVLIMMFIIGLIAVVPCVIIAIIITSKVKKEVAAIIEKANREAESLNTVKIDNLIKALQATGYEKLTQEELDYLSY